MFREANRLFGNEMFVDDIDEEEFLDNTYAAVLDFRTDPEWDKAASGLTLDGSKSGVKIGIKRASGAPAVQAYIFISPKLEFSMNLHVASIHFKKLTSFST